MTQSTAMAEELEGFDSQTWHDTSTFTYFLQLIKTQSASFKITSHTFQSLVDLGGSRATGEWECTDELEGDITEPKGSRRPCRGGIQE